MSGFRAAGTAILVLSVAACGLAACGRSTPAAARASSTAGRSTAATTAAGKGGTKAASTSPSSRATTSTAASTSSTTPATTSTTSTTGPGEPRWETALLRAESEPGQESCSGSLGASAQSAERYRANFAFDPANHEERGTLVATVSGETVSSSFIQIGSKEWVRLDLPGAPPAWQESTARTIPASSIAAPSLLSDVRPIPGETIAGRQTTGFEAALSLAAYEKLAPAPVQQQLGTLAPAVTYRFYVGPAGHLRQVVVLTSAKGGSEGVITCELSRWGVPLDVAPPVG